VGRSIFASSRRLWRAAGTYAFLCLCLSAGTSPGACQENADPSSDWEQTRARLKQEATGLYAIILRDGLGKFERCGISSTWGGISVDEGSAKKYFGVDAHAGLTAPYHMTAITEVLDPDKKFPQVFCNDEQRKVNTKQRFEVFEAERRGKDHRLVIVHKDYSFPVFNNDYTRAAISFTINSFNWWDPEQTGGWEGASYTDIYEKRNGVWENIESQGDASWHGAAGIP
jgi:hypothetical protein